MPTLQLKLTPPQPADRLAALAKRLSGYGGRTQAAREGKTPAL
ncbi:MAG: hypothetical protein JWP22_1215 [Ramlibacter sp.]|nr:hypothetical protein [Ramlibacter sp.]